MYRLRFLPAAQRELSKLLRRMSARETVALRQALDRLQEGPRPRNALKLSDIDAYRVRIGDYRIIYAVDDGRQAVLVLRIARRTERTYKV